MPIKFRWPQDINAIKFGATLVWGVVNGIITTIQGTSPLSLVNAVAGRIKSLVQYGKCTTVDDEIYCNNGKLVAVDDELPSGYKRLLGITFDGNFRYETGEVLTGNDDVTMTLENLSSSGKNVFGSYNGANNKNFSLYIYGSTNGSYFRFGDQLKRPKYGSTSKRTITFGMSGTSGFSENASVDPDEFTTPANVYIGMLPNSSSPAYTGDIIGSIIVSNRLEWIPCERESDGVIGYYEKYNGTFLEPVGGGTPVSLGYDTSHLTALSVDGTPEVLTIGEQTATVENLLAVDDIKDEQDIISGTVTRRCETVISDGTTPSGRYIGEVGDGNIIVKVRETGYEGDVATFEATEAKPLNGLTVNVEPIQDLHGYDSPWPAGGGKNLLDPLKCSANGSSMTYGLTVTHDRATETWTISGTPTSQSASMGFNFCTYSDFSLSGKGYQVQSFLISGTPIKNFYGFRNENEDKIAIVIDTVANPTVNMTFKVSVATTSQTAWSPYSNICPISGRTSATVTRTGKNLLDVSNTTHSDYNIGLIPNTLKPNTTYTFSINGTTAFRYKLYLSKSATPLRAAVALSYDYLSSGMTATFTTPSDMSDYPLLCLAGGSNGAGNDALSSILPQVEVGTVTSTSYEPYAGNTYTIALGDTVYGGQLDVTQGKMVVDRAMVDMGTLNWTKFSVSQGNLFRSSGVANSANVYNSTNFICSNYATAKSSNRANGTISSGVAKQFDITDNAYSDVATFKSAMSGVQLCYELATPFEITLTPTQIETLIGTNNIWSDAGSVKAYVADAELIEHVTAQPLRTVKGSNAVSVTSAVDPVQLKIDYYKNE